MSIAPIIQSVTIAVPQARAFDIFTGQMGRWWRKGRTVGAQPHVDIVLEPRPGGRWFERDAAGVETDWGKVIGWDPHDRILLAWQLDAAFKYDASFETEVEVKFDSIGDSTRITLEHRQLDRFGPSAQRVAEQLGGGWPTVVAEYAAFAEEKVQ
ncbi:SRPBCC family protein [soil metagenome]